MEVKRFYDLVKIWNKERMGVMEAKGTEYTISSKDKLANFKRVGDRLGLSPLIVAMIFTLKHVDSLCNYAKTGATVSNETIEERIVDIQNYMDLIRAIILEQEKRPEPTGEFISKEELKRLKEGGSAL